MPSADFDLVRKAWAAASRGDIHAALAFIDPGVEIVPFGAAMERRTYRGHAGVLEWWEHQIIPTWTQFEVHPDEFREVGGRLLVLGRWRAKGRASGLELDVPATWIVDIRDQKIVRWETYTDRSEALKGLGISE